MADFVKWYNIMHLHSVISYVKPVFILLLWNNVSASNARRCEEMMWFIIDEQIVFSA